MESDRERVTLEKLNQLSEEGRAAVEGYIEFLSACERARQRGGGGSPFWENELVNSWGEPEDSRQGVPEVRSEMARRR